MNIETFNLLYNLCETHLSFPSLKKVNDVSYEEAEKMKKVTLRKGALEDIGKQVYIENLVKILKRQYATNAPDKIILRTLFHLASAKAKNKQSEHYLDYVLIGCIWYKYIRSRYGDINYEKVTKGTKVSTAISTLWYNRNYAFCLFKKEPYPDEGYPILDGDFLVITSKIYEILGYSPTFRNVLKLSNNLYILNFCFLFPVFENNEKELNDDELKIVFSPYQYQIPNHPILKMNKVKQEGILNENQKKYSLLSGNSNEFNKLLFLSARYNIEKNSDDPDRILESISDFKSEFYYIPHCVDNDLEISSINEGERDEVVNQYIYLDLQESIRRLKKLLIDTDIKDYKGIFYYLNDNLKESFWYNNLSYQHKKLGKRKLIFELSRLFLYQKIGLEQFNRIHSIYEETMDNYTLARVYNLIIGKFSLAFTGIGTKYFTEGYNLLLKLIFKSIWLQNKSKKLENFIVPKEASNDLILYTGESDSDIHEAIFEDEGLDLEFKASLVFDWKKYLSTGDINKMRSYSIIKPTVSMLNSKLGGKIIIGIREKHKVEEELQKEKFTILDMEKVKLERYSRSNNNYLTGINKDLEILEKDTDQLKNLIDEKIKKHVYPNPFINHNLIKVDIKNFLGKKICIINIQPSGSEYYLREKDKQSGGEKFTLFIRHNASDRKVMNPKEAIEYYKSKIGSDE